MASRKRQRTKWEDTMKEMAGSSKPPVDAKKGSRRETRTHLQRKNARKWTAYSSKEDKQRLVDARLDALEATDYRTTVAEEEVDEDDDYEVILLLQSVWFVLCNQFVCFTG
jgi:hypothetical protein